MSTESLISLMHLLQLSSPSLPVGAYSYAEGLEYLVEQQKITNQKDLQSWLSYELSFGSIRMEAAVFMRAYEAIARSDFAKLWYWNSWLTATRESEELRLQSWQMGHSLMRLLPNLNLNSPIADEIGDYIETSNCNFAIAFAISAYHLNIDAESAAVAYLHSWMTNLVSAGVKLIPLGQTSGQQLIFQLHQHIADLIPEILLLSDRELSSCSWGLALASMNHEMQYTRLFRS